jgi:hypothetical protein
MEVELQSSLISVLDGVSVHIRAQIALAPIKGPHYSPNVKVNGTDPQHFRALLKTGEFLAQSVKMSQLSYVISTHYVLYDLLQSYYEILT